jgi:phenylalanyl-tRNA synthetase beta chain
MKVGYSWLQEYIAFEWSPSELADQLTAIGTAVDGIDAVFERFSNVVIGRVENCERHPKRPDLNVLTVDIKSRKCTMVSGAPNCRKGLLVAAALPGAELPGLQGKAFSARKIDGVSSDGMCCSELELGISDDGSVLMELDPEEYVVGDDLFKALELDEVSLSFELTPNRSDCLSAIGIAREIAALVGGRIRRPEIRLTESSETAADLLRIEIDDPEGCPRYAGRLVRGGVIRPSPFWLKRRLLSAGMRPINNAVDITNFVMLETGQPLHAFDWSKFPGGKVLVRSAEAGEKFVTLDDVGRTLPAGAVMITDGERPVAIGGVMGGAESEVTADTTDILIESAHFNSTRIRRARTRLGMATESALRFEKGVDPNGVINAVDRAAQLFAELTGAEILGGVVDNYPAPIEPLKLELEPERANRVLGTSLSSPTMIDILANLEFGVVTGKPPAITVPTFRPDVTREIDLIEEIARIYGYERIPIDKRSAGTLPTAREPRSAIEQEARELLEGYGLCEMISNSLTDPGATHIDPSRHVVLRNPLSADLSTMRSDLIGGLLTAVAHNRNRQVESVPLYELGRVFQKNKGEPQFSEHVELVIGLCGKAPTPGWGEPVRDYDFFDLKGIVSAFLSRWLDDFIIAPEKVAPFAAGESFTITTAGKTIGTLGHIDTTHASHFGVKEPVWAAVIDFGVLTDLSRTVKQYQPLPRFPAAFRDIAVVVDPGIKVGDLEDTIREAGGELVHSVTLFDRYSGKSIAQGRISIAFSICYRMPDRTLTDDQVDSAHQAIVAALAKNHDAKLRE